MKTKFRAWDKELKEMAKVISLSFYEEDSPFKGNETEAFIYYEKLDTMNLRSFDAIELMQYTNLNDSNGVEIYEGDVVSHDQGEYSFVGYVARDCYTFFIKGISQLESLGFEDVADTSTETADLTIIGNIYENSELLEGE